MNDYPTKACVECKVPVELSALQPGGNCPRCSGTAAETLHNPWEIEHDYEMGSVTHFLELDANVEGCESYCEITVDDLNGADNLTWAITIELNAQGAQPDLKSARQDAIRQAAQKLAKLISVLEEAYEREQ